MPTDREQEALEEMSRTRVGRREAWWLIALFALVTGGPGLAALAAWTEESPVDRAVRPVLQEFLYRRLGRGNGQVLAGDDGWLTYRPSVMHLVGEPFLRRTDGPDPRRALWTFHEDLMRRGIDLVVVPVPVKPSVEAAPLGLAPGLVNRSWRPLLDDLRRHGVGVVDPLPILLELPAPRFLRTDTHWRPEAMDAVAAAIAAELRARGVPRRAPLRRTAPAEVTGHGDLVDLLGVDPARFTPDTVSVPRLAAEADPAAASVLLLGDSFANIYADASLGFGTHGGLADAIAHHIGGPVDAIVVNAGGALDVRLALAAEPERLDGIDIVVWELAARELSFGDWQEVSLPDEGVRADPRWMQPPAAPTTLRARVRAVSEAADPNGAPYPNQVLAVHLGLDQPTPSEAWAFAWALRERVPQPAAAWSVGDEVTVSVIGWAWAPEEAKAAMRSDLRDRPTAAPLLWIVP